MKRARHPNLNSISRQAAPLLLALGLAAAIIPKAWADGDHDWDDATRDSLHRRVERGEIKSLAALRAIVQDKVPGSIVSTKLSTDDGRITYEFRVLRPDNRMVEIELDAASGAILEMENEE
ncbi:PepSY domain-containing protein [Rhizobium sp. RU36D]|uniref:PepSY domain-containing protein n=1 Tax=Rhizobium sp. RU36D TaxID=1907415 RepID=UPI0009D7D954|nr:PepSY domain-containing protein [Rhizobium sp. RU36D]SMD02849.1 Uncharacterized membrane protein YkoI [Rhizobium sp. RU36D]